MTEAEGKPYGRHRGSIKEVDVEMSCVSCTVVAVIIIYYFIIIIVVMTEIIFCPRCQRPLGI